MGWVKGSDLTPDRNALRLIQIFCNRTDKPIPLRGSRSDAPLLSTSVGRYLWRALQRSSGRLVGPI